MTINALHLGALFCCPPQCQLLSPYPANDSCCVSYLVTFILVIGNILIFSYLLSQTGSSVVPGESISSDTALGYNNEAELSMNPWPACEEDPELNTPTDVVTDSDARHWLQLSPTDASNLTGNCIFEKEAPVLPLGNPRVSQLQEF